MNNVCLWWCLEGWELRKKRGKMGQKTRQINYEALRVVSMLMIIAMHYLQKGGFLLSFGSEGNQRMDVLLAWLIESFCIGAANVYVLISGYFLVETAWKWQKLAALVGQVFFYSLGGAILGMLLGIGEIEQWSVYDWIPVLLPFQAEHYWFPSAYLVLYLLVPLLQAGVKMLSCSQLQLILGLMLGFWSLEKTLSPVALAYDRYGYDPIWFICLFLTAAWIRLYGQNWLKGKLAWISYGGTAIVIWLLSLMFSILAQNGFPVGYWGDMLFSYNHLLVLFLSVSLFQGFSSLRMEGKWIAGIIGKVSPYCFGVYLLHEHLVFRYLWPNWLGVERVRGKWIFFPHLLACVCIVFVSGVLVDYLRSRFVLLLLSKGKKERNKE